MVGEFYQHGFGIPVDYAVSTEWFQKGAELNVAEAIYMLGVNYENGRGVPKNLQKAFSLYSRAGRHSQV